MALEDRLSWLSTEGNRIVAGVPVPLRGVNWSGMEYAKDPPSRNEVQEMVVDWQCNVIRLPFQQAWALEDEVYRQAIDEAVRTAAELGAYTLLDLQWIDSVTPRGKGNFVPSLPDEGSVAVWRLLGARYQDAPAVLYDIFNEPHDPLADDPEPARRVSAEVWLPWAQRLVEAVRSENARALVFVSGTDWGYDLRGLEGAIGNVVLSTHVYRNKTNANWDEAFGDIAGRVPVFAGEWGGCDQDVAWGRRLAAYFIAKGIGWTAWSWRDKPLLRTVTGAPTRFGAIVRDQLALSPLPPGIVT